jgi:hypothetical protein
MKKAFAYSSVFLIYLFFFILIILHILNPDVNPLQFGISYYTFGNFGWLMDLGFILIGTAGIFIGIGLWPENKPSVKTVGAGLLICWGLLSMIAGMFPLGPSEGGVTPSGIIHNIAGRNPVIILLSAFLLELSYKQKASTFGNLFIEMLWFWIVLVSLLLLFIFGGPMQDLNLGGLFQRLYWIAVIAWLFSKSRIILIH